jgi:D-alanyl-D-alanine carboxypeptidase/D-alanyl-D-alanine-endopeptidase (penicillin-binding protein 4)
MNKANLVSGLKNLLHRKELQGAVASLVVKDEKGNTLLAYNPGLFMVPASTMKLIATSAALHILGPDYRFQTKVFHAGALNAGTISGSLIIQALGDPTPGSHYFGETSPGQYFDKMLQPLKAHSINKIDGDIIIDESYFGDPLAYQDWALEDYPWYYGALPKAFNFIDNCFAIKQNGGSVAIADIPGIDKNLLRKEFEVFTHAEIDEIKATGSPGCEKISVYIDPNLDHSKYKEEKLSLADPARIFKESFKEYLKANGITVSGRNTADKSTQELGTISSPALSDIVKNTHFDSINLFAECIGIAVQKALEPKQQSLNDHWQNTIGNSTFIASDGSGLSRKNLVTANFLADMLSFMVQDGNKAVGFAQTLPELGKEGTVKNYCKGIAAKNTVRLKTGSMGKVRSFAGVVEGQEKLVFAMIFNNYQCSEGEIRGLCNDILKEFATA